MEGNTNRLEKPLISVIIPTYNKGNYITKSLESILNQTYTNFEIVIVDDGSLDNTKEIVDKIQDERIKYIRQENNDQLNAILNGYKYIKGDIVVLFHSDDLLYDSYVFEKNIKNLVNDKNIDGLYFDFVVIDENDRETGEILYSPKNLTQKSVKNLLLNFGSNEYKDHFFLKRDKFEEFVINNYLIWNTPYWLPQNEKMLKLKKMNYHYYKYRVFNGNYKESNIGKFCLLNGVFRTIIKMGKEYDCPFFKVQRIIYLIYKKILKKEIEGYFKKGKFKNLPNSLENLYNKVYNKKLEPNDFYFYNIIKFYKNTKINRSIYISKEDIENCEIFYGKDMRKFYKLYNKKVRKDLYIKLLDECIIGFNKVIVEEESHIQKLEIVLKFLNIDTKVELIKKRRLYK